MIIPNPWLSAVKFTSTYSCLHSWAFAAHFRLPEDQKPLFLFDTCLRRIDDAELTLEKDEPLLPTPLDPYHGEFLPAVLVPKLLERGLRILEYKPEDKLKNKSELTFILHSSISSKLFSLEVK
jgi:hypothetical protein